ncbi:MAG TPA: hypothetical protein VLH56_19390 [Dissulfurispiraceae bacterium]|nr:hypothetical protein [Dissulfurispiraceae bacterium]
MIDINDSSFSPDDEHAQWETCDGCGEQFPWSALNERCTCNGDLTLCPACAAGYTLGDDGLWHPVDTRALRAEIVALKQALAVATAAMAMAGLALNRDTAGMEVE